MAGLTRSVAATLGTLLMPAGPVAQAQPAAGQGGAPAECRLGSGDVLRMREGNVMFVRESLF